MSIASVFESEAAEIPALVARQSTDLAQQLPKLVARLDELSPALAATIARGSSGNVAAFAGYLIALRRGLPTVCLAPSIASVYGEPMRLERALVLAISQSGASPDLSAAVRAARAGGAFSIGLVNETGSPLGREVDAELQMGAGAERAVAATKTFVLSVTAVLHLLAAWDRDAALRSVLATFPVTLARCDAVDWSAAAQVLAGREHAFVVGRGPTLPIAREIALKLAEVPGIHAQAESAAELLHGPISIASPAMAALVLAGDPRSQQSIREAITRLRAAGAAVLLLSPELEAGDDSREVIVIPRAQHDLLQPIVSLCAMYPFLARLARERGRDPDRPPNLQKLTRTI